MCGHPQQEKQQSFTPRKLGITALTVTPVVIDLTPCGCNSRTEAVLLLGINSLLQAPVNVEKPRVCQRAVLPWKFMAAMSLSWMSSRSCWQEEEKRIEEFYCSKNGAKRIFHQMSNCFFFWHCFWKVEGLTIISLSCLSVPLRTTELQSQQRKY